MNADTTKSNGRFRSIFFREPDATEKAFLRAKYPNLNEVQMAEPIARLSHVLTGEMELGYVMRYSFYEGRTDDRVDPVAGRLYLRPAASRGNRGRLLQRFSETLTTHFTQ